jgi:hypothetical protein
LERRKRGARISSFIVESEPISFTAVVRDEAKLLVLIAPVDGTPLLPTAEFKIGSCSSASSRGERYRGVDSRAIRQMSYFVIGKGANVERPCAAAGGGAVEDQRRDTISTVAG